MRLTPIALSLSLMANSAFAAVSLDNMPDFNQFYNNNNQGISSLQESIEILENTKRAFNENCADADLSIDANKQLCSQTSASIIQNFATEYRVQYDRGNAISQTNFLFAFYGAANLKRICDEGINRAITVKNQTSASLECIRSIYALENQKGPKGINPTTGLMGLLIVAIHAQNLMPAYLTLSQQVSFVCLPKYKRRKPRQKFAKHPRLNTD